MIETIQKEIILRKDYLIEKKIKSVYFGGGTPSLLIEKELKMLMDTIHTFFSVDENAEITIEANPDDINIENLKLWKTVGINRLSIGLQSFKEMDLKWMNRAHTVEEALSCVKLAQEYGFENISVDLIYGLPELSLNDWKFHIDTVLKMGVPHVSAYCLTVEEKTALHKLVAVKSIIPLGEDEQSDQFLILANRLKESGFLHYEISNFGRPGFEAVHNSNYWKAKNYLGVGPSAHSFNGTSRRWNVSNNSKYMKLFGQKSTWFEEEMLTDKDRWNELILTGLRTSFGAEIKRLKEIAALSENFKTQLKEFSNLGWLFIENERIFLSDEGRLKADHIASELFID